MTEPTVLLPGEGRRITGGGVDATLKVAGGPGAITSTFEMRVPLGFDVGAHVHRRGEELFYVIAGELELLAFEPVARTGEGWWNWESPTGQRVVRGGPGTLMHVPAGCPHAFRNTGPAVVTMLFQSAPAGHEDYFAELAALLERTAGQPAVDEMVALRERHDIHQLNMLRMG